MATVEESVFNPVQEPAESVFDPTYGGTLPTGKTAADENVFDPTYGGTLPTGQTAADENVFDPTYGGTLPTGKTAADENVFDPTYGGTLPLATGSGSVSTPNLATSIIRPTQQYQQTFDNPLFEYESYTYNLSWHILTKADFNNLTSNPQSAYIPNNCLVASGGKNSATFRRNPHFIEDFYFDDFRVVTTVNTTSYNKNSNAIQFEFTIIEPSGFTMINRLLDAVQSVGGDNYMLQPYLLMIEFTGYKDGTMIKVPNQTKYLPFVLHSMKSAVTPKGTEYRIAAGPYNHSAFNETLAKTPALIKVEAKTVQDLLGTLDAADPITLATINAATAEQNQRQKSYGELKSQYDSTQNPEERAQLAEQLAAIKPSATSSIEYQSKGLCDGINAFYQSVKNNTGAIKFPNLYRVVFDAEIGNSLLIVPNSTGSNNISNAATRNDNKTNAKAATGIATGQIDFNSGTYNIKPATSIMSVIEYAVRNSQYLTKQLVDPTANNVGISQFRLAFGNNLRWYRVIPKITLGAYDDVTKTYQKFITYYVKPWTVSVKNPYAPLGRASGYTKKYDYIFTGQNRDVIDCKIDFDMLFYLQLTANVNKIRQTETQGASASDGAAQGSNAGITVPTSRLQPYGVNYIAANQQTSVRSGPDQGKAYRAADTSRDLTLNSRGDMINVKLRIIGDPHFIKQDDLFYNQSLTPGNSMFVSNNNQSLVFDDGELYVYLNFESPTDYNDATGLAIPGISPYQYSAFRGVYKIIKIDNEFRSGKFEQVLDLARLPIDDDIRNSALNIQSRFDTLVNQGLGQLVAFGATRFSGPLILQNQVAQGIVNAAVTGDSSSIGGLVQGLVGQAVSALSNQAIGKAVSWAKDLFSGPSGLGPGSVGAGAENVFAQNGIASPGSFAAGDYVPSWQSIGVANDAGTAADLQSVYGADPFAVQPGLENFGGDLISTEQFTEFAGGADLGALDGVVDSGFVSDEALELFGW